MTCKQVGFSNLQELINGEDFGWKKQQVQREGYGHLAG